MREKRCNPIIYFSRLLQYILPLQRSYFTQWHHRKLTAFLSNDNWGKILKCPFSRALQVHSILSVRKRDKQDCRQWISDCWPALCFVIVAADQSSVDVVPALAGNDIPVSLPTMGPPAVTWTVLNSLGSAEFPPASSGAASESRGEEGGQ